MSARLRVAMPTHFPRPADKGPGGGVEAVARTLALALGQREDVEVHVVTARSDVRRAYTAQMSDRVTVHYLPRLGRLELPTLFLHDRWLLGPLLRSLAPDVVHTHDLGRYAYVCRSLGYPYVLTVHGISSIETGLARPRGLLPRARLALLRRIESAALDGARLVLANSTYVLQRLPSTQRGRALLIPNPIDPQFLGPTEQASTPGRIVWVGRVIRLKALDVLVRALPLIKRVVPAAHLRVIGPCEDPVYAEEVRQIAATLGVLDAVHMVGARHGAALRAEYAQASVLALPSRQENVPVTIAEAMAVGRAVVATRVGGVADLVTHGETGLLCEPDDARSLAQSLVTVLADPPRAEAMGSAARARALEQFDPERIAARHYAAYCAQAASSRYMSSGLRTSTSLPVR